MTTMNYSGFDPALEVPSSVEPLRAPKRKEAQEQFRQLMDHLEQIFRVADIDTGSVDCVSPAYETIRGRTCQSLCDEPRTIIDSIHAEDRARKVMADWLRATCPDLRVLVTSGDNDEIIAQNGDLEPGMAFLPNPHTLAALAGHVRELLDTPF